MNKTYEALSVCQSVSLSVIHNCLFLCLFFVCSAFSVPCVAPGVEEPGPQGEGQGVGQVPDHPLHGQHDRPVPLLGVVSNEAEDH